jgi:hypothetical protein
MLLNDLFMDAALDRYLLLFSLLLVGEEIMIIFEAAWLIWKRISFGEFFFLGSDSLRRKFHTVTLGQGFPPPEEKKNGPSSSEK